MEAMIMRYEAVLEAMQVDARKYVGGFEVVRFGEDEFEIRRGLASWSGLTLGSAAALVAGGVS
jgi:hypothetical protein